MQSQKNHKWTENDHIVAFYLYKYSDRGLKYTLEELGEKMGMGVNSLHMRIRNYSAVDGAGGLANGSKVVMKIYNRHKDTPQQTLKARVEAIICAFPNTLTQKGGMTILEELQQVQEKIEIYVEKVQESKGQGFVISSEDRILIEKAAMDRALDYLLEEHSPEDFSLDGDWGEITDVSKEESYDLLWERKDKPQELHIEVKGTTSNGTDVILTPNEIRHARDYYPNTALIIVSNLVITQDKTGKQRVQGGQVRLILPWQPLEKDLTPLTYKYSISKI